MIAVSTALTVTEWDFPDSGLGWLALCAVAVALVAYVIYLGRRDTRVFPWYVTAFLTTLRLGVVVILGIIWLNPRERTQTIVERPSRLAILVDTSQSMRDPNRTPQVEDSTDSTISRAMAARALLAGSPVIEELEETHEVHLFTFDRELTPWGVLRGNERIEAAAGDGESEEATASTRGNSLDWDAILEPRGAETRLGDALSELLRTVRDATLAGVVVVSDGGLNAGSGEDGALVFAQDPRHPVRIATIGVGGLERAANLVVTEVRAPSEVRYHRELSQQDPFEVTGFVVGNELGGKRARVELLRYPAEADASTASLIAVTEIVLPENDQPAEIKFPQEPDTAGEFRYVVRAQLSEPIAEYRDGDNQRDVVINFSERNTSVLMIAGGPMRDYHFVRNLLYRTATVDLDVWLQTVSAADLPHVSQEADDLLATFPAKFPERPIVDRLPEGSQAPRTYDVVILFDIDWSALSEEDREVLSTWVERQRGGLILVAGNVYTPLLADADASMDDVRALYPVRLSNRFLIEMVDADASQRWPLNWTSEGNTAGFLQLAEEPEESARIWSEFEGVYRAFPTRGAKDLAEVYATFPDPKMAAEGEPIVLAAQQYGGGRVLYIGSPEVWRLRAESETAFDTFWTKAIREVGQGRLRRSDGPGIFLLDRESYLIGETVRVRARLSTPQGEPLSLNDVQLRVTDPEENTLFPGGRSVAQDPEQAGQYTTNFRTTIPGRYQIELELPSLGETISTAIEVTMPQLEQQQPEQNRALLMKIAQATRGEYLPIEEAADKLPALFETSAAVSVPIDERLRVLWDRAWLMYLVIGLLCVEWLTRKLLRLA